MLILFAILFFFFSCCAFAWLKKAEKRMETSFQSLSYEMMERNSRSFLDLAKTALEKTQESGKSDLDLRQQSFEALITPLKESIKTIGEHQRELEKRRESSYVSLGQQIDALIQSERQLRQET